MTFNKSYLLYLLVSMCVVIGKFSGWHSPAQPARIFLVVFIVRLFRDLSPNVLNLNRK